MEVRIYPSQTAQLNLKVSRPSLACHGNISLDNNILMHHLIELVASHCYLRQPGAMMLSRLYVVVDLEAPLWESRSLVRSHFLRPRGFVDLGLCLFAISESVPIRRQEKPHHSLIAKRSDSIRVGNHNSSPYFTFVMLRVAATVYFAQASKQHAYPYDRCASIARTTCIMTLRQHRFYSFLRPI
jgi:hypothetical protein